MSFFIFVCYLLLKRETEMTQHTLAIDAWIREAQEALKLVEDIESRIKNKDLAHELRLRDKLLEVGVKLDRLESLLHNPPLKPILYVSSLSHIFFLQLFLCWLSQLASL